MKNKKLIGGALDMLSTPKAAAPTAAPTPGAPGTKALVTATDVAALKASYGAKWDRYVKRGNPYGRISGLDPEADYTRTSIILYHKQLKALQLYAKEEGLLLKQAFELALEIGLIALGAKTSEEVEVTAEDLAPKYTKKKKTARSRK